MCYGLIVATPNATRKSLSPAAGSEISVWPIANPWAEAAIGEGFRAFLVGDGRHCSCGRVRRAPHSDAVVLEPEAASLIADAANATGRAVFLVHWFSGLFDSEEFLPEDGGGVTSHRLRSGQVPYELDRVYWVAGTHPGDALDSSNAGLPQTRREN